MENFYYSQEITASDLNSVAIDLGAQQFSQFKNGVPYAVEQLNQITQALASKGITTNGNKFKVEKSGANIIVGNGIGIFSSGKKISLESPLTLPFTAGELFIENDETLNVVSVKIGELPANDYIHLATLNADGTITDKRVISKAKVSTFNAENTWNATQTIEFEQNFSSVGQNAITPFSLDVNGDSFKYIIFLPSGATGPGITKFSEQMSVLDVATGKSRCAVYRNRIGVLELKDNLLLDYSFEGTMGDKTNIKLRFVSFGFGKVNLELETTIRKGSSGEYLGAGSISGTLILC